MPNIALVLSGAVSLGSWEAGVLDELLFQLDRLNQSRAPADHFKIDVITGASAGAMTGALVSRAVMVDLGARKALREAWVDEIDITRLLKNVPENALLSTEPINRISAKYIAAPSTVTPSSLAPPRLKMRFTITNMSGVDYALEGNSRPGASQADFISTFHAETREFSIDAQNIRDAQTWTDIRDAAIASGNFPFAFKPKLLAANEASWPGHATQPFPADFVYIDGGLFNNEPLGEAVALARGLDRDAGHQSLDPSRIFILVDANLNKSKRDETFNESSSLPETIFRTLSVTLGESSALDWLKARRFNNEVGWRDDFLGVLAELVQTTTLEAPADFLGTLEGTADEIVDKKREIFSEARYPTDYRQLGVERTLKRYAALAKDMDPTRRKVFGTLAFLVNSVSGLDKKDELNVHVIYTTPSETAGDQLRSFAGFFSPAWRLHDYRIGRRGANAELPWILERGTGSYPRESGVTYEPPPLGNVTMVGAPKRSREMLRDATMEKIDALTKDLSVGPKWISWGTGPFVRWGIRKAVRSKVSTVLEL